MIGTCFPVLVVTTVTGVPSALIQEILEANAELATEGDAESKAFAEQVKAITITD